MFTNKKWFRMNFPSYEIEDIIESFPSEKSTLEDDFEDFELAAIHEQSGVLKKYPHIYLGQFLNLCF